MRSIGSSIDRGTRRSDLCKVELQRIVRTQTDVQPRFEEVRKRVSLVCQEKGIVTQRAHSDSDLLQVEQILQSGHFAEKDAMRNGVRREECSCEMVSVACFAGMRAENECV